MRKLRCYAPLNESDSALIGTLTENTRLVARRTDLVREGDSTNVVHIILE